MNMSVLTNVSIMLVYMAMGYALCKSGKGVADHAKSMSGLLIYILSPGMIINSFLRTEFTQDTAVRILEFFLATLVTQILFFLLLYVILHKKYENPAYRILTAGAVLGNVGFLGMPIISGIYPDQPIVTCYSSIYVMSMNLLVFTVGIFLITNDKKFISLKSAIMNPTTISILIALPLFLFKVQLPAVADNIIALFAKMVTPFCMIILGMRLSATKWKDLFSRTFVYVACALKLIAYPLFAYLCVYFLPFFDETFKVAVLVLSATPTGAVVGSMAELHECEQELSANVVLLTTIFSVITIPIILLLIP